MRPKERFKKDPKKTKEDENGSVTSGPYKKRSYNPGTRGSRANCAKSSASLVVNAESQATSMQSEMVDNAMREVADGGEDDPVDLIDDEQEPDLPPMQQSRVPSQNAQVPRPIQSDSAINAAAIASLQRAIQSSPARFLASRDVPIALDGHSPDPTRRTLFSSPKTAGPLGVCSSKSNKTSTTIGQGQVPATVGDPENKENEAPISIEPDPFEDLFSDMPVPGTPSPGQNLSLPHTHLDPFKTPIKKTPSKKGCGTGDFFSSAAKVLFDPATPENRTATKEGMTRVELTPFSRSISHFFSESPSRFFDNLMPMTNVSTPNRTFASTDLGFNDFPSTDFPMLSSPPRGIFGIWVDPAERRTSEWDELGLGSPVQVEEVEKSEHVDVVGGAEPSSADASAAPADSSTAA